MEILIIVTFVSVGLSIAIYIGHSMKKLRQHQAAEEAVASFFEFNKQVAKQLQSLEDQGRNCYRSLDGETMRLMYEAQRLVQHGFDLERLGFEALSSGNTELLAEVAELFNLSAELDKEQLVGKTLKDLSPRCYQAYSTVLMKTLEGKISQGVKNLQVLGLANQAA